MELFDILKDAKITKVLTGSATSSTTAAPTSVIDMQNFESVLFVAGGLITSGAGHLFKLQKVTSTTGANPEDLSGASVTVLNGRQSALVNVHKPRDRYIRGMYIKASVASAYEPVFALQYNGRKRGANVNSSADADSGFGAITSVISPTT